MSKTHDVKIVKSERAKARQKFNGLTNYLMATDPDTDAEGIRQAIKMCDEAYAEFKQLVIG